MCLGESHRSVCLVRVTVSGSRLMRTHEGRHTDLTMAQGNLTSCRRDQEMEIVRRLFAGLAGMNRRAGNVTDRQEKFNLFYTEVTGGGKLLAIGADLPGRLKCGGCCTPLCIRVQCFFQSTRITDNETDRLLSES